MIIYQSPKVILEFSESDKQFRQTWLQFVPSQEFRKAIDLTVEFVKNNDVASILSDTLKQKAVLPQDSEYAANVMDELFRNGVMAMAFVLPEDIFTQFSLKKFAEIDQKYQHKVEYFRSVEDAIQWINSIILP